MEPPKLVTGYLEHTPSRRGANQISIREKMSVYQIENVGDDGPLGER